MKNKIYCVSKAINHRTKHGTNGLDWSNSMSKYFDSREEAEVFYESIVSEFDFDKYTTKEYKYNICLYEPIITKSGQTLSIPGKILNKEYYSGEYFT